MQIGRKTSQNIIKYLADDVRAAEQLNEAHSKNIIFLYIYTPRFSHQSLLCEKSFLILLRLIRETERVTHTRKNRFVQSQTTV